jgi:unsaturated rhamnogalacturonyl hydrolase
MYTFLLTLSILAASESGLSFSNDMIYADKVLYNDDIIELIIKVNDHWQKKNREYGNAFWDNAAYQTGNIAAYHVTGLERYLDYSMKWAEKNEWKGAKSKIKEDWKYSYGETDDYVLFGDWQICFQTYIDLFNISGAKDSNMIARAIEVMEYQMNTDSTNYWWWADGLYMVMPVMTKLYQVTGNVQYLEKLSEYFNYANDLMYDKKSHLFYRDAKYIFPEHKTLDGKKDFWSRGNGWVVAGLAKILQDMPDDYAKKEEFVTIFKEMAYAVKNSQQTEGYWTRSLLDPDQSPGPETSGTAFFTYGLLWGINQGILDRKDFEPVVKLSWDYLTTKAINKRGRVGYVQPIGERAIPGQVVNKKSTSNFGVGAVLLAASEMYRLLESEGH